MKGLCPMTRTDGHTLTHWDPEDVVAWEGGGQRIARRNLIWSIVTSHIAFSIWYLFSVMVLFMPKEVYGFSTGDKLSIGVAATLVGAAARIPYPMLNAKFGGRNWAVLSSAFLFIPTVGAIFLLRHPGLPLWPYLICAGMTGLGGANYSASMANIEAFYPQRLKGFALGLVGGIANLGSASIQAVGLIVMAIAGNREPYWVCAIYLVALSVAGVGAALSMDNLHYSLKASDIKDVLNVADSWFISFLYLCCSGSYLGFAFAFGQLLQHNFVAAGQTSAQAALHASEIAFIGPLLGGISRVYGGRLSDRYGGGRVSLGLLIGLMLGGSFIVFVSSYDDHHRESTMATVGFILAFIWLFIFAGAGKASVYKLIPSVFAAHSLKDGLPESERLAWARARSGSLIGFAGAMGSFGGVLVNMVLRESYHHSGSETPAFWVFLGCYAVGAVIAYLRYVRPSEIDELTTAPHTAGKLTAAEPSIEALS